MSIALPATKTNHAYRLIKEDILAGTLAPGSRLRLAELAESYNVSEMPVREALRMLQQAGLVVFENHRGATVAELSFSELYEVIETRTYLEILAICQAVPFHTKESLAELGELHAQMTSEAAGTKYFSLNHSFHLALYRGCKNAFLKQEIDGLWERAWRRWSKSLYELRPDRIGIANAEHLVILDAIRRGAVDEVEWASRLHRESTLRAWRSMTAIEDQKQLAWG